MNEAEERLLLKACSNLQKQVGDMKESTMKLQFKKFNRMVLAMEKDKSKQVGKKKKEDEVQNMPDYFK